MTSCTKIVDTSVNNKGSADDGGLSAELDEMILDLKMSNSVFSSGDISKISNVSNLKLWASVNETEWVVMWSSGLASLGEVSELMDVESMESWSKACDFGNNFGLASMLLSELDKSFNT